MENLKVCEHCLLEIESREGNQLKITTFVDKSDEIESMCDLCHESGFNILYELV